MFKKKIIFKEKKMLKKWIIRILTAAALAVFLYSMGNLLAIRLRYRAGEKLYSDASENYTQSVPSPTPESAVVIST